MCFNNILSVNELTVTYETHTYVSHSNTERCESDKRRHAEPPNKSKRWILYSRTIVHTTYHQLLLLHRNPDVVRTTKIAQHTADYQP